MRGWVLKRRDGEIEEDAQRTKKGRDHFKIGGAEESYHTRTPVNFFYFFEQFLIVRIPHKHT